MKKIVYLISFIMLLPYYAYSITAVSPLNHCARKILKVYKKNPSTKHLNNLVLRYRALSTKRNINSPEKDLAAIENKQKLLENGISLSSLLTGFSALSFFNGYMIGTGCMVLDIYTKLPNYMIGAGIIDISSFGTTTLGLLVAKKILWMYYRKQN